jgi:hypothetical protein
MSRGWLGVQSIFNSLTGKYLWTNDDGSPAWEFPNASGNVQITASADPYIKHVEHFNKILAVDTNHVRATEDLSAALPITFTIDLQPDVPRRITFAFTSHAQITAYALNIRGITAQGEDVTEYFTTASGWTFTTAHAFATITAINLTTRTGTGAGDTMNVGISSSVGLANTIELAAGVYKVVKSVAAGNAVDYSGANITAEAVYHTVDLSTGGAIADGDNYTIYYKSRVRSL